MWRPARTPASMPMPAALMLLVAGFRLPAVSATCYYPDGSTAADVPCTDLTTESTCCGTGYACYGVTSQYFLCMATGDEIQKEDATELVRGSCTDPDWRSSNCPSVCVESGVDNVSGGNGVGACPGSGSEFYCISSGYGVANCSTKYHLIDFAVAPSVVTTIGVAASTTSTTSTTSTSTTSTTTSSTLTTWTTSSTSSSTTSTTAAATITSAAPTAIDTSGGSGHSSKVATGVGVSVGIVGALAAGALLAWIFIRRQRKKLNAATPVAVTDHSPNVGPPPSITTAPTSYVPPPGTDGYYYPNAGSPSPLPSELYNTLYMSKINTHGSSTMPPLASTPARNVMPMPVVNEVPATQRHEMP